MVDRILGEFYEIQRQLGKQTGRETLLARDLRSQELVVIKLLSLGSDFEWQHLKLFEREAETLKSLSHPSIPRYLDYLELDSPDNKGFALVQTYVEGKTLEEHLKAGRTFSEAEVKELAKALLEILIYLHGHQPPVIHRDIKPSNILLGDRSGNSVGKVYLVDFGSVQTLAAREGGTITVVGTYGYMPPEQFGGRATPASDLYSLGATLIYLVTGLHPTELLQKDFRIQFQQVANVSKSLTDWLEWMTEPSLEQRPTSAREALQALETPRIRKKTIQVFKQPPGSDVILNKTDDFLEIILPPKGLGFGFIGVLSLAPLLLWGAIWIASISTRGISGYMGFYMIAIALVVTAFLILLARWIVFSLFVQIRFRIDRREISFFNDLWGWKWRRSRPLPRQNILGVEFGKGIVSYNSEGELTWTNERLIVRMGNQKYELIGIGRLSEAELNWLAQELNTWLGVPIILDRRWET